MRNPSIGEHERMSQLAENLVKLQTPPENKVAHLSVKLTGTMAETWDDLTKLLPDLSVADILKEAVRVRTFMAMAQKEGIPVTVHVPGKHEANLGAMLRLHGSGPTDDTEEVHEPDPPPLEGGKRDPARSHKHQLR